LGKRQGNFDGITELTEFFWERQGEFFDGINQINGIGEKAGEFFGGEKRQGSFK
jgi:hypothetical protein